MRRTLLTLLIIFTLFECAKKKKGEEPSTLVSTDEPGESTSATIKGDAKYSETLTIDGSGEVVFPGGAFDRKTKVTLSRIENITDAFNFPGNVIVLGNPVEVKGGDGKTLVPIQFTLYIEGKYSARDLVVVVNDDGNITVLGEELISVEYAKGVTSVTFSISSAVVSVAVVTKSSAKGIIGATDAVVVANPVDFALSSTSATSLTFSWGPPTTGATGVTYLIAYAKGKTAPKTCGAGTVIPAGEISTATSWEITGLAAATGFALRLCAQTSDGVSPGIITTGTTGDDGSGGGGGGGDSGGSSTPTPTVTNTATATNTATPTPTPTPASITRNCGQAQASNDTSTGTVVWTDTNVTSTVDGVFALASLTSPGLFSNYLRHAAFGFSLPAETTSILGVVLTLTRKESGMNVGGVVRDARIYLLKGGLTTGSDNKAEVVTDWPTNFTEKTYGSATDLWGHSLTKANVENVGFGFVISIENPSTGSSALEGGKIDYCAITVYYQ